MPEWQVQWLEQFIEQMTEHWVKYLFLGRLITERKTLNYRLILPAVDQFFATDRCDSDAWFVKGMRRVVAYLDLVGNSYIQLMEFTFLDLSI
jgi:hypothetical protein